MSDITDLWIRGLSGVTRRLGKEGPGGDESRSVFQRDYDRIIFFDAFRRLQNKTQVLPAPNREEVRNRLTHSLETASVGRSLGYLAAKKLWERHPEIYLRTGLTPTDMGYMVSAAALAHDIGNPPFGHEGEKAVSAFFRSPAGERYLEDLNPFERADFQNFEGNAAGFRILTRTPGNPPDIRGGLRLSFGTLGAFIKYPQEVDPARTGQKNKYGFFQSEKEYFLETAEALAMRSLTDSPHRRTRFPWAYLTEAADDICYTIIDYEDGYHLGFIPFERIRDKFEALARLDKERKKIWNSLPSENRKIGYLRAHTINRLIGLAVDVFTEAEKDILAGTFRGSLTDCIPGEDGEILRTVLSESQEKIYHHPAVLKNEAAGKTVIPFLLEKFLAARFEPDRYKQYHLLMPPEYRTGNTRYEKIMDAVMFVTSMSDRRAVEWYKNFNGIQLADY
ncbi:MAG: dNTP triphosphohydrolase [Chlorobi bacterium]|nr:dNTP triphosphohydrolase [Chlorobiota bacterium]